MYIREFVFKKILRYLFQKLLNFPRGELWSHPQDMIIFYTPPHPHPQDRIKT